MAVAKRVRVILIEEGMGNLKDCQYYTREAIESGVKLFEGAKSNSNHPDALQEQIRPEGDVLTIVGHYENCEVIDGPDGQAILQADWVALDNDDGARAGALLERALYVTDKTDKQFVGLSINASGVSNTIALDEFMKSATIPKSALPKLLLAKEQGIEEIELCTRLTEAESCDIVTRAGARGRVVKLLETEKIRMALKTTKKPVREGAAGAPPAKKPAPGAGADGSDGGAGGDQAGHADADQDKELIASMLKKAMGDGEHSEEAHQAMKQAHEKALKCGYEGEAAEEAAVAHMKMSHEVDESEGESEGEGHEAAAGGDSEDPAADAGAQPSKGGKGAMEREIIQIKAQNAKLMERFAQQDAVAFREKALRESGLGGEALKALGGVLRGKLTEKAIAESVKVFKEAYGHGAKESTGFVLSAEKTDGGSEGGFSLADCIDGE